MGLLDRLINKGARALGDAMADKLVDTLKGDNEVGNAFRDMKSAVSEFAQTTGNDIRQNVQQDTRYDTEGRTRTNTWEKSFEEKLQTILENAGNYELRKDIRLLELEREFGQKIYEKKNYCYAEPQRISYAVYSEGTRVLYIQLWDVYWHYKQLGNTTVREFCRANGIKMIDFFEYLPNDEDYMEQRIREYLI